MPRDELTFVHLRRGERVSCAHQTESDILAITRSHHQFQNEVESKGKGQGIPQQLDPELIEEYLRLVARL